MKRFLVDTNIPSELTRERPDPRIADFLNRAPRENIFLSVMTIGEICKGIEALPASRRRTALQQWLDGDVRRWFAGRIFPITEEVGGRWGKLAADAKLSGRPLALVDGLIAATALTHSLSIVSRDTKDFANLGVELINPWEL